MYDHNSKKSGKMDVVTGFLCNVEQHDDHSVVLVTNSCVLSNEEIHAESVIKFNGVDVHLNMNNFVVETTYAFSDKKKVCIYMSISRPRATLILFKIKKISGPLIG